MEEAIGTGDIVIGIFAILGVVVLIGVAIYVVKTMLLNNDDETD